MMSEGSFFKDDRFVVINSGCFVKIISRQFELFIEKELKKNKRGLK
jgi:hypothetical protein